MLYSGMASKPQVLQQPRPVPHGAHLHLQRNSAVKHLHFGGAASHRSEKAFIPDAPASSHWDASGTATEQVLPARSTVYGWTTLLFVALALAWRRARKSRRPDLPLQTLEWSMAAVAEKKGVFEARRRSLRLVEGGSLSSALPFPHCQGRSDLRATLEGCW